MPACYVDPARFRTAPSSLAIFGHGNPLEYGGWAHVISGITAGHYYTLTAYFRAESVHDIRRQVLARVDWLDASGRRAGPPENGRWSR
jgi:hypothetical protein